MQFVDANIFIRFLTQDHPEQARACRALFQRARRNEVTLTTSEAIIAEVVYILSSKALYHLARAEIRSRLYPLLTVRGLKLPQRRVYLRALDLYTEHGLDFADALAVAQMERQKVTEIYSYDHDFNRLDNVSRLEP